VIEIVGLDHAGVGIADRPHHPRENPRDHLQARGRVVGCELPRLRDREARAVPVHALLAAHEEHAQLVHASAISSGPMTRSGPVIFQFLPAASWSESTVSSLG
jgi:hypothetical protein